MYSSIVIAILLCRRIRIATRRCTSKAASSEPQIGEALRCLEEAERLTPEQTRTHRAARAVARDLIQLSGSRPRPELRELAERLGVLP